MNAITLFSSHSSVLADPSQKPAYLQDPDTLAALAHDANDDIHTGPTYPVLSIKGKVFSLKKDGETKPLMRPDSPDETLQSINVVVVRANPNARSFYQDSYVEGSDNDNKAPTCYTFNGKTPAVDARNPQCANCAACPHNVWGTTENGQGTACAVQTRLAVVAPELLATGEAEPTLLRLPPGSRRNFADLVSQAKRAGVGTGVKGIPFWALMLRIGFDPTAPAPKLTFKTLGIVNQQTFAEIRKLYDSETVREIVGLAVEQQEQAAAAVATQVIAAAAKPAQPQPQPQPAQAPDNDINAMLAPAATPAPARATRTRKPAATTATPAPATAPATPTPAASPSSSELLQGIDSFLGGYDD